jgi:ribosomal protein L22
MYTFEPEQKFAKACNRNMRISTRKAAFICKVIRKKPLNRAKRLLSDLNEGKRSLDGKYYSKTVSGILKLLESCEKNAEFMGLDSGRLFVHASAHQGATLQRRRRKSAFGSRMKATNMEIMLVEKGKAAEKVSKSQMKKKTDVEKQIEKEKDDSKQKIAELKQKSEELKEKVHHAQAEHKEQE